MWTKHVDVEIVLSNPGSIPGNLSPTEANYGNGWSCVDVAAEIIKCIQKQFPECRDDSGRLRDVVRDNLRVCFLRSPSGTTYQDGGTLGLHCRYCKIIQLAINGCFCSHELHSPTPINSTTLLPKFRTAKHFIVDDICCYIGSQNLYICDLAEWGVVLDSPPTVEDIKSQYWDPMWGASYTPDDCDVEQVMDGLKIDRTAPNKLEMTKLQLQQAKERIRASHNVPANSNFHPTKKEQTDDSDEDDDDDDKDYSSAEC
jgi:hypothetical protein